MDSEQTIAQRLQANIHRPDEEPKPPTTPTVTDDQGFTNDLGDNINLYKLYDYFHVEPSFRNGETEQKIQVIYRWASSKVQSTDYLAVANVLTAYSQGMGAGSLDMSGLEQMYQFVQLDKQINYLQQEQGLLYR